MKEKFEIFRKNKKLVYFDSAATTQKPREVIEKEKEFYENFNSNVHRSMCFLGEKATNLFENSREKIGEFIGAFSNEIIFTRGTTESINLLSYSLKSLIPKEKNEIVITELEHHSNLVPWQQLARRENMKLIFIKLNPDFSLNLEDAKEKINSKTALVSLTTKSNVLGEKTDYEKMIKLAKKFGALTILDAAQSITTEKFNVKKIGCDFLAFSCHKAFGPTGIGILYGRKELLEKMDPFNFGGEMVEQVDKKDSTWNKVPQKFEAGTPNIAGAIAFSESIKFIESLKQEKINHHEKELSEYLIKKLEKIKEIKLYSKDSEGIISFNVEGIHPHDISCLLNDYNICIRVGYLCAMPLVKKLDEKGVCRVSFSIYNDKKEIDYFVEKLNLAIEKLK